jgi:CheY-like chemotaxis protein
MMLIVDDDPKFLQNAGELLGPARNVLFARNAEQAKTLLRCVAKTFSVALVDLDMPGQDGFSLIMELRRS